MSPSECRRAGNSVPGSALHGLPRAPSINPHKNRRKKPSAYVTLIHSRTNDGRLSPLVKFQRAQMVKIQCARTHTHLCHNSAPDLQASSAEKEIDSYSLMATPLQFQDRQKNSSNHRSHCSEKNIFPFLDFPLVDASQCDNSPRPCCAKAA